MARIRSKDTGFELGFINEFRSACKVHFDRNATDIFGKPDLVFRQQRLCVFLDSDFWHGWQFPRWKHKMKNDFWREKISKNRRRDLRVNRILRAEGWRVVRIWEHNIRRHAAEQIERVCEALISSCGKH